MVSMVRYKQGATVLFLCGVCVLSTPSVYAGTREWAAASCTIDNNEAAEANVNLLEGVVENRSAVEWAKLSCNLRTADATVDWNTIDSVVVHYADFSHAVGNDAVLSTFAWKGTTYADWEQCDYSEVNQGGSGYYDESLTVGPCAANPDSPGFVVVYLPAVDYGVSFLSRLAARGESRSAPVLRC